MFTLFNFYSLQILNVGNCQLKTKDLKRIALLENLEVLYLENNQLTHFPLPILQLKKLKELHLFSNQIAELPKSILTLSNLEGLHMEKNNFKKFPKILKKMRQLKRLSLYRNEITEEQYNAEMKEMTWLDNQPIHSK